MKVLSLTQPWASLVVLGEKEWETRGWRTHYRGPIAIHASKGYPKLAMDLANEFPFIQALHRHRLCPETLPVGAIIGMAQLVDCKPVEEVRCSLTNKELAFGNYDDGRYCFRLVDPVLFETPIPAKGALGLWNFTSPELKEAAVA
jgi:hypothetical protein